MMKMRRKAERGFTLVEVIVASALLIVILFIATDTLIDIMGNQNLENLSYRVNQEASRMMDRITRDVQSAGFRFAGPVEFGLALPAMSAPSANDLSMRCVTGMGELAADAVAAGTTVLSVSGFTRLPSAASGLVLTNDGIVEYVTVSSINVASNQIVVSGLSTDFPAGTLVATIDLVRYQVSGAQLIRYVNGTVVSTTTIDPEATSIGYTLKVDLDGDDDFEEGETTDVSWLPMDSVEVLQDAFERLLTVNIALQLTRTSAATRGETNSITQTVTQRIKPLNLSTYY